MLKRIGLVCLILIFLYPQGADAAPKIIMDNKQLELPCQPIIENGSILVPLRSIFEALGATVQWDNTTKTVTASKGQSTVKLIIGGPAYRNGEEVKLAAPARIVDGNTMVPLRFVSEAMNCKVAWDNKSETVTITQKQGPSGTQTMPQPRGPKPDQSMLVSLAKLGFKTEPNNPKANIALLAADAILLQYKLGLDITGEFDDETKAALEKCLQEGRTYEDIMKLKGKQLQPICTDTAMNGKLDTSSMISIPTAKVKKALLPENTAVGWAILVLEAAKDPKNDISVFLLTDSTAGYRSYEDQAKGYQTNGPATAAIPGNSPHGLGKAIDFNTSDPQTGRAQSYELKWLEKNAAALGFSPTNNKVNGGAWEPYFPDGAINYYETWHWNFAGINN
ncbi:MAG: stalk domain-containing protein [Deltaproteobacteria bacterium]